MATVTLSLKTNPISRKPEIHIEYESDPGALGHEHEQEHRALAEKLLGASVSDADIVVTRALVKTQDTASEQAPKAQREAHAGRG